MPCSLVSQVYYKRKLSCYNLSFYSLGDKGTCFLWNETDGERGSCEVATCLHKYVTSLHHMFATYLFIRTIALDRTEINVLQQRYFIRCQ